MTGAARVAWADASPRSLAAAGAKVACIDLNVEILAETVAAIRAAGGEALPLACNVTDSAPRRRSGR